VPGAEANRAKPATSQTPETSTSGSAARVSRSSERSTSGTVTAATPAIRDGISAQATGSDTLTRPIA